jgi:hypothetical protein
MLQCFTCNYDDEVAKEFSIDCETQECAANEIYCADATLEHAGRRFIRKRCSTSQFCNSTGDQCVQDFQHTADYTACHVKCCSEDLCNPYNEASSIIISAYLKSLLALAPLLVRSMVDKY